MAIFDLFSKRQKRLKGDVVDIFIYDNLPLPLRVQIVHIIQDCLGKEHYKSYNHSDILNEIYENIHGILCREYGVFQLSDNYRSQSDEEQVLNYLLTTPKIEEAIDIIELTFKYIDKVFRNNYHYYKDYTKSKISPDEAILELNERFKEHSICKLPYFRLHLKV